MAFNVALVYWEKTLSPNHKYDEGQVTVHKSCNARRVAYYL